MGRRSGLGALRRLGHRIARAYHLACARDDVRTRGLRVPVGVWVCDRCARVLLEAGALHRHVLEAHPAA